jgi:hypothetical protein
MFADWVKAAVRTCDLPQREVASLLTARLRRKIDTAAVNKMMSGKRAVAADEMLALAEITGYPLLISLEGKLLDPNEKRVSLNEAYLVKLISYALQWQRKMTREQAYNLGAALVGAARTHPGQQDIDLTDDQLERVALALAAALGSQAP